jgi:integrase/recombinase XerD
MAKQPWPIIRKRVYPNGSVGWIVDCRMDGRGERVTLKTKAEAMTAAEQARVKRQNEGQSAFDMPADERADAKAALAMLRPHGRTLREAAAFMLKHLAIVRQEIGIAELTAELLETKARDGASTRYLADLRSKFGIFARAFPRQKVTEFSPAALDDWLRSLPVSSASRNQTRRLLGVLFSYAVQRGYALSSPVAQTSKAKVVDKPPGILTVAQASKLLECAEPEIQPAVALAMFAGLRPESEIVRLDWSHIDFESRLIDIAADRTKTAQKRFVKIHDNLLEWLLPHRKTTGAIVTSRRRYFYAIARTKAAAGIKPWPADCLRHTFASMHFAAFKNAGETAQELGHVDLKMLFKHYRERVKPAEALKFWEIRPAAQPEQKVVQIVA